MKHVYSFDPLHFRLTRSKRVAIMIFLVTIFFTVSPLIIFYTMGFRYDLNTGIVRTTGVISVDIEPRNAQVYVRDAPIEGKMPLRLSNRTPGTYGVRIEKEGYKTWEKEVVVESNQTVYIDNFELLKDTTRGEVAVAVSDSQLFSLPITESILGLTEMWDMTTPTYRLSIFDTKKQQFEFARNFEEKPKLSLSPFHSSALVVERKATSTNLEFFESTDYAHKTLFSIPTTSTFSYQWSKRSGEIYLKTDNKMTGLNLEGNKKHIGFATSSDHAWYVEYPETLWIAKDSVLYVDRKPEIAYSIPSETKEILDINQNRILVKTAQGFAVIRRNDRHSPVADISGHSWYYDHENQEWWIWSDFEFSILYEDGSIQLLGREGKKIHALLPLNQKGMKLVIHEDEAEAINPGIFPAQRLIEYDDGIGNEVFVFPKYKTLYFTAIEDGMKKLFTQSY